VQIAGDAVRQGEIVVVGAGETIPVDGRVLDGAALVNQAAVTGEDIPVAREAPRRVISGSVIVEGRLRIEATQVGDETTTARVARFIQDSLAKQSATQRMADELAEQRVYITLGTGALVYALTRDLTRLQSVFLVDYSCALKLGTPVAFKSGLYQAAGQGVLIKGGEAMEQLAGVDTLVFDKTGTLTHSELTVTDVLLLGGHDLSSEEELLALVASVEEHASHPVAQAVVEAAKERDLNHISHGEVDYLVAHGLSAEIRGGRIVIGSRHYLEEHEGIRFSRYERQICQAQEEGKTLLFIGKEQRPLGLIALRDTLRREAPETLQRLRGLGIERLVMISGDRREKAEALGAELGFDAVFAEVEPEQKAELIRRYQRGASHRLRRHRRNLCATTSVNVEYESVALLQSFRCLARSSMGQYIHDIPGRLRVRSGSFHCRSAAAETARQRLLDLDGVSHVRLNLRARSITVNYDPGQVTRGQLLALLERCGCIGAVASPPDIGGRAGEAFGKALAGAVVNKAIERSALKLVSVLL